MAKKKLTKDQINQNNLKKQYNAQVNRIRAGYRDISNRGGLFSVKVEDIIGDRYNPEKYSKRDITKLKKISKESLYRMARTETGKSGYTILKQRRTEAGRKGAKAKREKREREKHPRLDTQYNFLHLTPQEFENIQVTGNIEYYGKGMNRHASIVDVNLVDTSTGEIIESSDRGVTPVEVNGTIYQYDPETNRFIPSSHIPQDARKRWYKEESILNRGAIKSLYKPLLFEVPILLPEIDTQFIV